MTEHPSEGLVPKMRMRYEHVLPDGCVLAHDVEAGAGCPFDITVRAMRKWLRFAIRWHDGEYQHPVLT